MKVGTENTIEIIVTNEKTARTMGSGTLDVFATPAMIALMEQTAAESVESMLEPGQTSVGTLINAQHLASTPIGMKVVCKSVLKSADGRKLVFDIEVRDEVDLIGKAEHHRFIVDGERFLKKTNEKI